MGSSKAPKIESWRDALSQLVKRCQAEVSNWNTSSIYESPELDRLEELLAERRDSNGARVGLTAAAALVRDDVCSRIGTLGRAITSFGSPADISILDSHFVEFAEGIAHDVETLLPETYHFFAPICSGPILDAPRDLLVELGDSSECRWLRNEDFKAYHLTFYGVEDCKLDSAFGTLWCYGQSSGYLPYGFGWERVLLKQEKILDLLLATGFLTCDFAAAQKVADELDTGGPTDIWYSPLAKNSAQFEATESSSEQTHRILTATTPNWTKMTGAGVQRLPNTQLPIERVLNCIFERTRSRPNLFDAAEWWVDAELQRDSAHRVLSLATAFEVFFAEEDAPADLENRRIAGYLASETADEDLASTLRGSSGEGTVSATLRTRVAHLLGKDHYERLAIGRVFKAFYDLRSRIVHQGRRRLGPAENRLLADVSGYLSAAILQEAIAIDPSEPSPPERTENYSWRVP